jgi:GNAT superfamily N-acetyltransferase
LLNRPHIELHAGHWSDLRTVMWMISMGSAHGHFNPVLRAHRVRLGLAMQLLGVMALGRLFSPARGWCAASVQVLRSERLPIGFVLLTWLSDPPTGPAMAQISLFKVLPDFQSRGLGTYLLKAVLAQLPPTCNVQAECLPASRGMQRLLQRQGFRPSARAAGGWQRTADSADATLKG